MAGNEAALAITFIGYILVVMAIAYFATKQTSNLSDYVLGGRQLSGPITALGAGASDMSSWLLMALPGLVYLKGLSVIWVPIALCVGAYCNWRFIAKRLRIYTELANDSLTIPEFFCNRFDDQGVLLRLVSSLATIIFFTYYAAAGLMSGALLIQHLFPEMPYIPALLLCAVVIISYTSIGGFLAVSWVDFFQGSLIFLSLIILPIVTCIDLGGVSTSLSRLVEIDSGFLDVTRDVRSLGLLSLFAWGLGYFGQLHINTRFMAIRSVKELPIARRICMSWMALALLGAVATGLLGFIFYQKDPLQHPDTVFIALSQTLFNRWMAGILLSAVASAMMSSVAAQILMAASILVEDFYHRFLRRDNSGKENLFAGRVILFAIALISLSIAAGSDRSIFSAVGFAWSGLGSSFGPVLILSLYWPRMTKSGAAAGVITGTACVLLWGFLSRPDYPLYHPDVQAGFEMIPGFLCSTIATISVSLLSEAPNTKVCEQFKKMLKLLSSNT